MYYTNALGNLKRVSGQGRNPLSHVACQWQKSPLFPHSFSTLCRPGLMLTETPVRGDRAEAGTGRAEGQPSNRRRTWNGMGVVGAGHSGSQRGGGSRGRSRQEEVKASKGVHRKRSFKGLAGKWARITSTTRPAAASSGGAISFPVTVISSVHPGPSGVYFRVG